jgi:hypothetical protein
MKKYLVLTALALLTLTCATLEGLLELSPRFIQFNGGLTIVCAVVFVGLMLKIQASAFTRK